MDSDQRLEKEEIDQDHKLAKAQELRVECSGEDDVIVKVRAIRSDY